jgi:eukaryotic-like serine/threonine-protein kinase
VVESGNSTSTPDAHAAPSNVGAASGAVHPRDQLLGRTIRDGWKIVERLDKKEGDSGGTFGTGYLAKRGEDELAFVKAIDFMSSMQDENIAATLLRVTQEFEFERQVMEFCTSRGMTKVLRFYGHDQVSADTSANPLMMVSCLIMEAGDKDLRRLVNTNGAGSAATCAWNLFILSDVALAVSQLHAGNIAHHDIKPSNVIATKTNGDGHPQEKAPSPEGQICARQEVKIGDLGRVLRRDKAGPYDGLGFAGDQRYQPLEAFYGHIPSDWVDSREAADAYMVGSLIVYLFTGVSLQDLIARYIPQQFFPDTWRGQYDETLLTVLIDATSRVLHEHLRPAVPAQHVDEILAIARSLTHPDPKRRGDPKARRQLGRPVGMDRVYQRLSLLARQCAARERGRSQAAAAAKT